MSERPAQRIMNSLRELDDFAKGKGGPITLYIPDGNGDLVRRSVPDVLSYRRLWIEEGHRVVRKAATKKEDVDGNG